MFEDQVLTCVACRRQFTWTVEAQRAAQLFEWWPRGGPQRPRRCPECHEVQRRIHGSGHR
jgi:hypothetical protein